MRLFLTFVAAATVLAGWQDASVKDRVRGVRDLAKQGPGAIPRLEPYLADQDAEVRWEAVKAIAELGTQRCLDPLIKATADAEAGIRTRAVDGIVNFYIPGYLKTGLSGSLKRATSSLKSRFTDTNTLLIDAHVSVRPEAIAALGKMAREGADMESRANAARATGILRGRAALEDLYEALRSKNSLVLYESLIAIQKIRDVESGPKIQYLLRDLHDSVQIAAIETTGILGNRAAIPDLRELVERARNVKVQRAVVAALAMMPEEQNRGLYLKYLEQKDEGLRGAAAEGLGRLKNMADVPLLERAFETEKHMGARLSLAFAMVMLGRTELSEFSPLQYLVNTLNSRSYQDSAEPLLVELGRDGAVRKALYPAIRQLQATKEEKMRLARVFGQTGDKETLGVLETLKDDTDAEVAAEGSKAARNIAARLP
ncbi:MAG: HEAT repeat domain-containing protein [Bryobacterales bacterium]|nr:HEAT repeat domain-containing protein [Bryobacterales bacterium]